MASSRYTQDVPDQDDASSHQQNNPTHISLENLLIAPGRNLPDDSSQPTELSPAEMDQLFLQTTTKDNRGREYGLGSLTRTYGSSTKTKPGSSAYIPSVIQDYKREFDQKFEDSQKEIASLRHQLSTYEMLLGYMKDKDPTFAAYLATNPVPHPSTNVAGPSGASETQPPDTNDFVNDFNI